MSVIDSKILKQTPFPSKNYYCQFHGEIFLYKWDNDIHFSELLYWPNFIFWGIFFMSVYIDLPHCF